MAKKKREPLPSVVSNIYEAIHWLSMARVREVKDSGETNIAKRIEQAISHVANISKDISDESKRKGRS